MMLFTDSWGWNLQIQKQLGQSGAVKFAYVGSASSRLTSQVPRQVSLALGPTYNQPFPQLGTPWLWDLEAIGHAHYNAFEAQYNHHNSHGLTATVAFTYSKNINSGCASFWEGCNIQNPYDMKTNAGSSPIDVPLVFAASATYDLPFGKGKPYANSGFPRQCSAVGRSMALFRPMWEPCLRPGSRATTATGRTQRAAPAAPMPSGQMPADRSADQRPAPNISTPAHFRCQRDTPTATRGTTACAAPATTISTSRSSATSHSRSTTKSSSGQRPITCLTTRILRIPALRTGILISDRSRAQTEATAQESTSLRGPLNSD